MTSAEQWPPAGVHVTCGPLELRFLSDELLGRLADLATDGIHAPDRMPFNVPWTRGAPDEVRRSVLQYHWRQRASWTRDRWALELGVLVDGELIGTQGFVTEQFAVTRSAETGSWLGLRHQGRGWGTLMRLAVLHLLFDGLDAEHATTAAFEDNGPSNGVTRRLGYRADGATTVAREGRAVTSLRYRMDRAAWSSRPMSLRPKVTLDGIEPLRAFVGLT